MVFKYQAFCYFSGTLIPKIYSFWKKLHEHAVHIIATYLYLIDFKRFFLDSTAIYSKP